MMPLRAEELVQRFGGRLIGDASIQLGDVTTDSRKVRPRQTFVALIGERFDAHDFVVDILVHKPGLLVLRRQWWEANSELLFGQNVWVVEDTLTALAQMAQLARQNFTGFLVGITGSSGKTTVKEMLTSIACHAYGRTAVLATQGNLNNHIGVPLTLLQLTPVHRFAIIEMGASGPGEIAYLATLARPEVSLVNNVMAAHVEGFGSIDGVAITKSAIYDALTVAGTAVINRDDDYADRFERQNAERHVLTFSLRDESANLTAENIELSEQSTRFTLCANGELQPVCLQVAGLHNVRNSLAAASCALVAGVSLAHIADGLAAFGGVKGRMNVIHCSDQLTLIDDTYNANPGSVKAAIDALEVFPGARWLVLGDMGELGGEAEALHADIGHYARAAGFTQLVGVGPLSAVAAASFGGGEPCENQLVAVGYLKQQIACQSGRINILIKGSRSARMELIVQAITDQWRSA